MQKLKSHVVLDEFDDDEGEWMVLEADLQATTENTVYVGRGRRGREKKVQRKDFYKWNQTNWQRK